MVTDQLRSLWRTAFGDSEEFIGFYFHNAYSPERCRYLAEGASVTAALHWLDGEYEDQKFAYIYAVATHPDFRGHGLCRKLMALTHETLREQGYAGALLMPAERILREMYAGMGYRDCCSVAERSCTAGTPIPVRPVDKAEYARLRRKFLPRGGLVQEGPCLDYLAAYAQFYAGEDFLLCAAPQKDSLNGIELLGDPGAAPGILAALGYAEGSFRIPGEEIPLVMFLPLREDAKAPSYCGLVFD